jgi:N-acyl-D-amino-acid deacylase
LEVTTGTKAQKLAKMKNPELRAAIKREQEDANRRLELTRAAIGGPLKNLIVQHANDQPEFAQYVGKTLGQIAEEWGKDLIDTMLDLSIAGDLNVEFLGPDRGLSAQFTAELMKDSRYTFPGVSDGGAHTNFVTGGAYTTDFLRWLVRDEKQLSLEEAHYRLSALPAHAAGFRDRSVLREGAWADVVVYDLSRLNTTPEWVGEVVHDFPGGEWRRVIHAEGYRSIIVNGQETFHEGKPTGATPGKLPRHGHA